MLHVSIMFIILPMRLFIAFIFVALLFACSSPNTQNIVAYHEMIQTAETAIIQDDFEQALHHFQTAFALINRPFGKDLWNAAWTAEQLKQKVLRNQFLLELINHTSDLSFIEMEWVPVYLTDAEWEELIAARSPSFDAVLRQEMEEIHRKDQLFRPDYDQYDDTINSIRKENLKAIYDLSEQQGFPSHFELGYNRSLQGQPHHIVLHHTAQRRSYDKSVIDLEPLFIEAINEGRLDPERAIYYLNFQNDVGKGPFEVYAFTKFSHPTFSDSVARQLWLPIHSESYVMKADSVRQQFFASFLSSIPSKASYLSQSSLPFLFSSVRTSVFQLSPELSAEEALAQKTAFA